MAQSQQNQTIQARRNFVKAFNATMFKIWAERIIMLGVYDTGSLYRSVAQNPTGGSSIYDADVTSFSLRQQFMTHGIWSNYGVGREVPRGNSGDIGRPKVRKKKVWFSTKYAASSFNLRDFMADSLSQECIAIFSDAFSKESLRNLAMRNAGITSAPNNTIP